MTHLASTRALLLTSALCALGCSQPTTAPGDTGSTDASTRPDAPGADGAADDAAVVDDAATADAGSSDAGPSDAGDLCNVCLADAVEWGTDGGRVCTRDSSELSPCRDYTHDRVAVGCKPPDLTCANELPCSGTDVVRAEEIAAALAHPDVVAALAAAPVLYGTDPRPFDGSVDWFAVGGERVEVGDGTVPAGVAALVALLRDVDAQQLAITGCAEVFPGT